MSWATPVPLPSGSRSPGQRGDNARSTMPLAGGFFGLFELCTEKQSNKREGKESAVLCQLPRLARKL